MKRKLIFLGAYTLFVVLACKIPEPDVNNLYIMETKVIDFEEESDLVVTECETGKLYTFPGIEDWCIGDNCILVMDNCGTESIKDDKIIRTFYRR